MTLNNTNDEIFTYEEGAAYLNMFLPDRDEETGNKITDVEGFKRLLKRSNIPYIPLGDENSRVRRVKKSALDEFLNKSSGEVVTPKEPTKGVSSELAQAQEITLIATEHLKAVEKDAQAKLIEHNWATIEAGLSFIDTEKNALKEERDKITKEKADNDDYRKELEGHIAEANQHRRKSNEILDQAEHRFKAAMQKENESQERIRHGEYLITELQGSIEYFNNYILPILDDLTSIKNALYIEVERWQKNTSFKDIFNFVSLKTTNIEQFLENVTNVEIPEVLKIKPPEQPIDNTATSNTENNQVLPELAEQLKKQFVPVFNLFRDIANIISLIGFHENSTEICQDLNRLDVSFNNNFIGEYDAIIEYFKVIAIDCEEIILKMKANLTSFKPSDRLAIEHNLDNIYELMPVLRPT